VGYLIERENVQATVFEKPKRAAAIDHPYKFSLGTFGENGRTGSSEFGHMLKISFRSPIFYWRQT
jgi:hypothetical protein